MLVDESRLVEQFVKGDDKAYALLYNRYVKELFSYGLCFTQNKELLKDLIQNLFVKILERRNLLAEVRSIRPFLFRSLRNKIIDFERNRYRQISIEESNNYDFLIQVEFPDGILEEEESQYISWKIECLLKPLSARQKEVISLRFFFCLEYDEIAEIMKMNNPKSVRNLLSQALIVIRKENPSLFLLLLSFRFPI